MARINISYPVHRLIGFALKRRAGKRISPEVKSRLVSAGLRIGAIRSHVTQQSSFFFSADFAAIYCASSTGKCDAFNNLSESNLRTATVQREMRAVHAAMEHLALKYQDNELAGLANLLRRIFPEILWDDPNFLVMIDGSWHRERGDVAAQTALAQGEIGGIIQLLEQQKDDNRQRSIENLLFKTKTIPLYEVKPWPLIQKEIVALLDKKIAELKGSQTPEN